MNNWISIKEDLPEECVKVLVAAKSTDHGYTFFEAWRLFSRWFSYFPDSCEYINNVVEITHWSLLPHDPDEDQNVKKNPP